MPNKRFNKQVPGYGYKHGGQVNTSRENRLEELGRVDAGRARTISGRKNLRGEKKRIVRDTLMNVCPSITDCGVLSGSNM